MEVEVRSSRNTLVTLTVALLLGIGPIVNAEGEQIVNRPLTPKEIHDNALGEINTSGGLMTIGVGERAYLEAQVPIATTVNGIEWALTGWPRDSVAQLEASPLPADMPIYNPGDREVNKVAGRIMLIPDLVGTYTVEAVVATGDGPVTIVGKVVAAEYTGVGIIGGVDPAYPQCALCHEEQAVKWAGTGHANFFELAIDGLKSNHYNEGCISCHVLGKPEAVAPSNNFFDVADAVGWTFPEHPAPGEWDAMPLELKAMANIQCEHCHGPGSIHHGDKTKTSISLSAGDCAQCHDDEPYHTKNMEWNISRHAVATRYPTGETRANCVQCHSGIGFIEKTVKGMTEFSTDYEAITCAVCHDPHDATNEHQVRKMDAVTLKNGVVVTEGGSGKLCMNCHQARQDGEVYAATANGSTHFGPHYGVQGDMIVGTNAVSYDREHYSSAHLYATEDACATCHMQSVPMSDPAHSLAGGHTFKVVWDSGTPDDDSDDVDMIGACRTCHGPIQDFNLMTYDYDGNGRVEGVQVEVGKLLDALGRRLPPLGDPHVAVTSSFTRQQLKAAYNYKYVEEDGSHGIHNTRYTVSILKAAIADLDNPFNTVVEAQNWPLDSIWYYSPWIEYYALSADPNWIYHQYLGSTFIAEGATKEAIWVWNYPLQTWAFISPADYPSIYLNNGEGWVYLSREDGPNQGYHRFSDGQWVPYSL